MTLHNKGFSLLEVMVVVVIVAILSRFAYPSYIDSVRKAKRGEAKTALMLLAQQQERYYAQNNTYLAFTIDATNAAARQFKAYSGNTAATSAYEISAVACTGETIRNCVKLTATPGTTNVDKNFSEPKCGALSLTSSGVRSSAQGSLAECW